MNHQRIYSSTPLLLLVWILSSCGGAGGGASSTRNLPPDPGSAATATVIGVDTNSNGVRDEIERDLSDKVGGDTDYQISLKVAAANQKWLTLPAPTTRDEALKFYAIIGCAATGTGTVYNDSDGFYFTKMTFDTPERLAKRKTINDLIGPGLSSDELPPCE